MMRFVLVRLADRADGDGQCWPTIGSIAEDTLLSERSVRRTLRDLEAAGLLRSVRRVRRSTVYDLSDAMGAILSPINPAMGDRVAPMPGYTPASDGGQRRPRMGDIESSDGGLKRHGMGATEAPRTQSTTHKGLSTGLSGASALLRFDETRTRPLSAQADDAVAMWDLMAEAAGLPPVERLTGGEHDTLTRFVDANRLDGWGRGLTQVLHSRFTPRHPRNRAGPLANLSMVLAPGFLERLARDARHLPHPVPGRARAHALARSQSVRTQGQGTSTSAASGIDWRVS